MHLYASSGRVERQGDAISLFKEEKYREIVDIFQDRKNSGDLEVLLLAKAFERLGLYSKSIKELKDLYRKDLERDESTFRPFVAYFIAAGYEQLEDYNNALLWYSRSLSEVQNTSVHYGEEADQITILTAVLRRVLLLCRERKIELHSVEKILKKQPQGIPHTIYFTALIYHAFGKYRDAADYYSELIKQESSSYTKKALEQITSDSRLIHLMVEKGISKTDLIHICIQHSLFKGALFISYFVPYSMYVAQLRAYCYFEIGEYETAALLYKDYYSAFNDVEALVKIAFSYYYLGRRKQSIHSLKEYLNRKGSGKSTVADAYYLKILLERDQISLQSSLQESITFVRSYRGYSRMESFIHDTFYHALQKGRADLAVSFLKDTYSYLKNPFYKSWASFILGLYDDGTAFPSAVIQFPGSYYYYRAAEKVEIEADIFRRASGHLSQNRWEDALDDLVLLYSKGIQKEYTYTRIVEIISRVAPYSYFYDIQRILSEKKGSVLIKLLDFGLYKEILDIIDPEIIPENSGQNILKCYLLSRVFHETGDTRRGVLYGEKMLGFTDRRYFLFLPSGILKLCYPAVYVEIIRSNLQSKDQLLNHCFILSLMRVESMYNSRAESSMGALGLLQLLPETANWIERRYITREELFDPTKNIEIGVRYLYFLLERFFSMHLVLAAYNGGPTNVKRWMEKNGYADSLRFVEEIPYVETRNFVKRVISTYEIYRYIYGNGCSE